MRTPAARSQAAIGHREIRRLLGGGPMARPTILEVGACDGVDTINLLRVRPRAIVHCFEPDERAAERWRTNVASRRATLHRVAIGARDGRTRFHPSGGQHPRTKQGIEGGWYYSGSIRRPKGVLAAFSWLEFGAPIDVEVRSLDSWSAESGIGVVDFIWADVQGAEVDLIAGGVDTLRRTRYLFTEYSHTELYEGQIDLEGILGALPDWELLEDFGGDVLLRNRMFTR